MKQSFLSARPSLITIFFCIVSTSLTLNAAQPKPCTAAEYRQFDFWIGEWEVKDHKDTVVGKNHIHPILNGCALSENWTSARGNKGVSYNFFDQAEKKWHQTWVDQGGNPLYLDGKFVDGKMTLSGVCPDKEGKPVIHQITWTLLEDGRVKQHWQTSTDNKKTWADAFVGY